MLTFKMKRFAGNILLILLMVIAFSCKEKKGFPEPDDLLSEDKMVGILCDMHKNQAYLEQFRMEKKLPKEEADDLYYSVLKKHGVPDSTFAHSVVFYSSMPKLYEKIYRRVVDRLKIEEDTLNKQQKVNIQPAR